LSVKGIKAMKELLSTIEAAEWLGMKESTLRDWRSDEIGPPYIVISPRCIRYSLEDLIRWRNDRRRVPFVQAAVEGAKRRISQRSRD
jgi:predicted DNA-binding transcriptional regulator AlpA